MYRKKSVVLLSVVVLSMSSNLIANEAETLSAIAFTDINKAEEISFYNKKLPSSIKF